MRVSVDITGEEALVKQLISLGKNADDVIEEFITDLVLGTQKKAVEGIQRGPASGRVYVRGGISHQASAPGEYPMSDTGRLASSVEIDLPTSSRLRGKVGTGVMYGQFLEFGTSKMAARPWLLPSFEWAKSRSRKKLKKQIEALI